MIPLTVNEIHVWMTDYKDIKDQELRHAYRNLLNHPERVRQEQFHFARDQLRYVVTRALARTVLSRYAQVSPRDWVFSTNVHGRPQIANDEIDPAYLSFNLSHTDSLIVLGVACGRALGVDVENVRVREISIDVAERFFSPAEVAALAAMPASQQHYRFFEYWTFKESLHQGERRRNVYAARPVQLPLSG